MGKRARAAGVGLAAALLAGALVAAAVAAPTRPAAKVTKIGIAAPEKANDYGWNAQGVAGARAAAKAAGAKLDVADGVGYDNTEPVLRQLAQGGANLIIAQASGYNTVAPRVAEQFKVPTITYDNPKGLKKGLVADIETSSQEGAYLAGVLAGLRTRTNTLGIVISAADTNWFKQTGGFVAGARSVNKNVKFLFAQIGQAAYSDAAGGKRVAQSVIAGGADIVFGMGDGASFGMFQAVETAKPIKGSKVMFIDVIGNKLPIDKKHVLLSSVIWDFAPIFKQAVKDVNDGTFGTHNYNLNVSDGISLLKTPRISAAIWGNVVKAQKGISGGAIKVPLTATKGAVDKLLKASGK
jgi:simple sugar transport system substrate-binding protein